MFDLVGEDVETITTEPSRILTGISDSFVPRVGIALFGFVCECIFGLFN